MHSALQISYFRAWAVITGDAETLVAAGVVARDKLPGKPGMPRGMVTLDADGSQRTRGVGGTPQMRIVTKRTLGQTLYEVWRHIGEAEAKAGLAARQEEENARASAWPFRDVVGGTPA